MRHRLMAPFVLACAAGLATPAALADRSRRPRAGRGCELHACMVRKRQGSCSARARNEAARSSASNRSERYRTSRPRGGARRPPQGALLAGGKGVK
jgi:hypothetical protein